MTRARRRGIPMSETEQPERRDYDGERQTPGSTDDRGRGRQRDIQHPDPDEPFTPDGPTRRHENEDEDERPDVDRKP
jgi:hypothetical protein